MTIYKKLTTGIQDAMKSKDSARLETLRLITSEVLKASKEKANTDVNDDDFAIKVLMQEHKKRCTTASIFRANFLDAKAEKEDNEAAIISEFLPKELSEEAITSFTKDFIAKRESVNESVTAKSLGGYLTELKDYAKSNNAIIIAPNAIRIFNSLITS